MFENKIVCLWDNDVESQFSHDIDTGSGNRIGKNQKSPTPSREFQFIIQFTPKIDTNCWSSSVF